MCESVCESVWEVCENSYVIEFSGTTQLQYENCQGWRGPRAARACGLRFVRNVVQMNGVEVRIPEICMKRRTNTGD